MSRAFVLMSAVGASQCRELRQVDGELDALDSLACLEAEEGRPEIALRLLTVTGRERARTGHGLQTRQDRDARDRALLAAAEALGRPSRLADA